jgi:hypothetical protein
MVENLTAPLQNEYYYYTLFLPKEARWGTTACQEGSFEWEACVSHLGQVHELGGELLRLRLQLIMAGRLDSCGCFQLFYFFFDPLVPLLHGFELGRPALLLIQRLHTTVNDIISLDMKCGISMTMISYKPDFPRPLEIVTVSLRSHQ